MWCASQGSEEECGKVTVNLNLTEQADLVSEPEAESTAHTIQPVPPHDNKQARESQEAGSNVETVANNEENTAKPESSSETNPPKVEEPNPEDEIDLEDPEIVAATAKIQAAYMKRQLKKPSKK